MRLIHENSCHNASAFLTLTYADEHLPRRGSDPRGVLLKDDLQRYFKRLRTNATRDGLLVRGESIKYYACGEYGEDPAKTQRPHYHAIIFGLDAIFHKVLFVNSWEMGRVDVGLVEPDSIRYVAGYVAKKLGDFAFDRTRPAPFQLSSQGLGLEWLKGNQEQILYDACVTFRGKKFSVPRYYREKLLGLSYPPAVEGMAERIYEAKVIALADSILELAPQFGGRGWALLDDDEREVVYEELCKRGSVIDHDLKTNQTYRLLGQIAKKRRKL